MSRTPNFFVERYNSELNKYEFQHPLVWDYSHTKRVPADLFPYNGCHDLFSIVEGKGYSEFPEMKGIHYGLPKDVCEEILNEYQKYNINGSSTLYMCCNGRLRQYKWQQRSGS